MNLLLISGQLVPFSREQLGHLSEFDSGVGLDRVLTLVAEEDEKSSQGLLRGVRVTRSLLAALFLATLALGGLSLALGGQLLRGLLGRGGGGAGRAAAGASTAAHGALFITAHFGSVEESEEGEWSEWKLDDQDKRKVV